MAFNPFRTFQRNQKGCMAGATLLAIISFLFLGVIIQLLGGRGGPGAQIETIAESRHFGKFTNYELYRFRESQEVLNRFLSQLIRNLVAVDPNDEERMRALAPLDSFLRQMTMQTRTQEQLVNVWLVTQYAQEEGLAPDWDDVLNLLTDLTGGYLSDAIYNDTLQAIGISHQAVKQLLTRYLLWLQSLDRFGLSVDAISPATRWDWYQRLYRHVTIEAAAVPIDSLIDQVGEPSNSQLNDLFVKYKSLRYNPTSAESGFIMPTELAFQYVIADPSQEMLDSITEEEMQVFYEENKDSMFRKQRPLMDMPQLPGLMPGGMSFPTLPSMEADGRRQTADGNLIEEEPQDEKPNSEEPNETEESTPEPLETSKVNTRLVSYRADKEGDGGQQTEEPNESDESEPVDLSILYHPFDEVKDQIRKELAVKKAMEGFPVVLEEMRNYAAVYNDHFERGKEPPPMPDLTNLAAERGLKLVTVPMGDVYAALQTDLARGLQDRQRIVQMFRSVPMLFEGEIFWGSDGQVLYWVTDQKNEKRPEKLDEVKDVVLKRWKEIEARALALKKAEELANEAKTSGQSLGEVFANRDAVPVVETEPFTWKTYGMNPMAAVMRGIPPMIGEVREKGVQEGNAEIDNRLIVAPGSEFMESVFSLQVGEIGVAFNQPQSAAYIVRVTSSSPSTETLWEQFQNAHIFLYRAAGQPEVIAEAYEAWLDVIRSKTGFRWVNKPDVRESELYDGEGY